MRFIIVMIILYLAVSTGSKSTKKSKDETGSTLTKKVYGKPKPAPPAIIAIEIVDPNENKTSKNSKRTIDSSLGYGYYSPPRYQVYKYSQHDIPPYRGPPNHFREGIKSHHYDLQKSLTYKVPQRTQNLQRYYRPGTTLYSTVNSQGQVGGLSSHVPQQYDEPQVPVIILRVYPSQLDDASAALHANLPQTHPLAAAINSIDIQGLLRKYVQNTLVGQQYQYQPQPEYQYQYQQPQYHYPVSQPDDGLLTHENYPKETHTRVVFRTDKNKLGGGQPRTETKTIQIALPAQSYSSVQVETPDMQYSYGNQEGGDGQNYYYQQGGQVEQNYYYQAVPESGYQQVPTTGYQQVPATGYQQVSATGYQQVPATGYQQVPVTGYQQYVQPEQSIQEESSYNHNQHKRSKKAKFTKFRLQEETPEEVIKLDPIKA